MKEKAKSYATGDLLKDQVAFQAPSTGRSEGVLRTPDRCAWKAGPVPSLTTVGGDQPSKIRWALRSEADPREQVKIYKCCVGQWFWFISLRYKGFFG
jgi:hypothetical protein